MNLVTVNRDTPADTLRGIACILLVAYHVIGIAPDNGFMYRRES